MSLIDRISHKGSGKSIPNHTFPAVLVGMLLGKITEAQIKSTFGLSAGVNLTEWNTLKASYDAAADKTKWLLAFMAASILAESNQFDMAKKSTFQNFMTGAE